MPRSLLSPSLRTLLQDSAPIPPCDPVSPQSHCCVSPPEDHPLWTSHPLSSYCPVTPLPLLAKPFTEFPALSFQKARFLLPLGPTAVRPAPPPHAKCSRLVIPSGPICPTRCPVLGPH